MILVLVLVMLVIGAPAIVAGQSTTIDESCGSSLLDEVASVVRNELKVVEDSCGTSTPRPLTSMDRETAVSALKSWSSTTSFSPTSLNLTSYVKTMVTHGHSRVTY